MLNVSKHSNLPQPLYPRTVPREKTPEEIEADVQKSRRDAFKRELSDYYHFPPPVIENNFDGDMNVWPDRSESRYGCDLTYDFVDWVVDNHRLVDTSDQSRWNKIYLALGFLSLQCKNLHQVIEAVYRDDQTLIGLSTRWGQSNKTIVEEHRQGLTNLIEWVTQLEHSKHN